MKIFLKFNTSRLEMTLNLGSPLTYKINTHNTNGVLS